MENLLYFLIPLLAGWLLDRKFGDPPRLPHLIVLFGRIIAGCEHQFNHGKRRMLKGAITSLALIVSTFLFALVFLSTARSKTIISGAARPTSVQEMVDSHFTSIIPSFCIAESLMENHTEAVSDPIYSNSSPLWLSIIIASLFVFYCLAGKTLIKEVREVFRACDRSLEEGRKQVARIVGRDTSTLSEQEVRTAALETLAENMSDGVVAPLFWYMLLGVPGMLAYKMINTLDSMIGYRNERYCQFGKVAARIDDVANYIPARLTAILMVLVSGKWSLFSFVIKFGNKHLSPNSGYPEAALAGILNCRFGGPHDYFGKTVDKPFIGTNERTLTSNDMERAIKNARYTELAAVIVCVVSLYLLFMP